MTSILDGIKEDKELVKHKARPKQIVMDFEGLQFRIDTTKNKTGGFKVQTNLRRITCGLRNLVNLRAIVLMPNLIYNTRDDSLALIILVTGVGMGGGLGYLAISEKELKKLLRAKKVIKEQLKEENLI